MIDSPNIYSLADLPITAPVTWTGDWLEDLEGLIAATVQVRLAYGAGGTSVAVYIQTSIDQGETAIDIACVTATTASKTAVLNFSSLTSKLTEITPTDAAIAADTALDGVLGDRLRAKVIISGTYSNSTVLTVRVHAR